MIHRAEIYWTDLGPARRSRPAKQRPVLVVQLPAAATRLPRDSVVNVTAFVTLNKSDLMDRVGTVPAGLMQDIDRGLRRVLTR